MANKKISELQLIDEVTSDVMLPSDDGIQSYRLTAAQVKSFILANENILLAMLKNDIFSGLTAVTPTTSDQIPLVDADDSSKTKKATLANIIALATSGRLYRAPQIFSASGTYDKVAAVNKIISIVIAGGGGGGGCENPSSSESASGGGGGGGGVSVKFLDNSAISTTETVTVGTGGAGGASGDNDGSAGGSSSFGAHNSATGGQGGEGGAASGSFTSSGKRGAGGVGSGGEINLNGSDGGNGFVVSNCSIGTNFGGAAAILSSSTNIPDVSGDGADGKDFGSGGSGGTSRFGVDQAGGDGHDGAVIILEFI